MRDKYQEVIGLEIHVQLLTKTKAYSSDIVEYGSLPNTNVSPITLAHPGTLPKPNKQVYEFAIKLGLALGCDITEFNYYDRKNYFYPDLPKGYQITQDNTPICQNGGIAIKTKDGEEKVINLTRIHMEEDSGKSMHLDGETESLLDLNRAGTALLEIVTEPEIANSEEAYAFVTEIRKLVRYLEICDGNMEEGSMRCDANISVMLKGATEYGRKVEVKNMNSIRNVARAIEYEIDRQIESNEKNEEIISETRLFDASTGTTKSMRKKEELNDYRFFPEPDLQPVIVNKDWIASVKANMPALPHELHEKFTKEFGLSAYDASVLTDQKEIALYFVEVCKLTKNYKAAANWITGPVKSYVNELTLAIKDFPLSPAKIVEIIALIDAGKISTSSATMNLFPVMVNQPDKPAQALAEELNLIQDADEGEVKTIIEGVLAQFPDKVAAYKAGNKNLMGMFMGQVMKATKGKADPKKASQVLSELLEA